MDKKRTSRSLPSRPGPYSSLGTFENVEDFSDSDLDGTEEDFGKSLFNNPEFSGSVVCPSELNSVPKVIGSLDDQVRKLGMTSKKCAGDNTLNFGVLVRNKYFTIYRSTGLGRDGLEHLRSHIDKHKMVFPKRIIYLNTYGYKPGALDVAKRVWSKVEEHVLKKNKKYHAGNFAKEEAELAKQYGFDFYHPGEHNTYLSGTDHSEKALKEKKIKTYGVKRTGDADAFFKVISLILEHGGSPVLFHCKGGIHRTGMVALMLRYIQGGDWVKDWEPQEEKITRDGKPGTAVLRNAAEREYYEHNPKNFRAENLELVRELFQTDPRFKCLSDFFGPYLRVPTDLPVEPFCYHQDTGEVGPGLEGELTVGKRKKGIAACALSSVIH